jgi:diguanylate cyclase (GGDEF)-like protein
MSLAAALLSWLAAQRPGLDRRNSQAWRLIAGSYLCYWAGDLGWFYLDAVRGSRPYPSLADVGYLSFYPFLAMALLRLPTPRRSPRERAVLALDTATVMIGTFLMIWYLVIGPTIANDATNGTALLARALDVAYPVGDVLVLFALAVVLLRATSMARDAPLLVLSAGLVIFVGADVIYARLNLDGTYSDGSWVNALWMVGQGLTIVSAQLACRRPRPPDRVGPTVRNPTRPVSRLPFLAIASVLTLLVVVSLEQQSSRMSELVIGVVVLTVVVALRQLTALQENRRLMVELRRAAATDHLTGIASRAQFFASAETAFERTSPEVDAIGLLMIDVDHFKAVNDTHGHADGDLVLQHVTARVVDAVRAGDLVARYGGDEIVVLLPSCPDSALVDVAERVALAVRSAPIPTSNGPVPVTVSIGGARSIKCSTLKDTMARADQALYWTKRAGRDGWHVDGHPAPTSNHG